MDENFVEGTLQFGTETLRVYYEHSLSYLSLISDNQATLRDVADHTQPHITLIP